MITIEPIETPKELFKNLYRIVRCHCSGHELLERLSNRTLDPTSIQVCISETIQEYTHKYIPSSYDLSFAKQLRVFMYAYRHHRLGGVSTR